MRRIGSVLLVAAAVVALATATSVTSSHTASNPHDAGAPTASRATIVTSAIDLHWLVGDENEPDENEGGDGDGGQSKPAPGSALPRWLLLTMAGLVLALVIAAGVIVARLIRRYRAWKQRMAFRMRRLSDDAQRAWRGFRP
jgi:hypothetical protein